MNPRPLLLLAALLAPVTAPAQEWNAPDALRLVERAVTQRAFVRADSGLRDYRARAHGFVFFLAQLGEGLAEPPRLVKSDELQLEVYWRARGDSKQRIVGWRDRADLPTGMQYHRDHLGIVQNNFGDNIRLGQGDEVRDVPHPLSQSGVPLYDYAATDTIVMRLGPRSIRVKEVRVRPKHFDEPRVAGSMFIDLETGELVVFRFNFTRASYLDHTVEDITVVLENGLWNQRFWLPRRQEIEIRRRTEWLDLPARGIIRGRWDIDGYEFNLELGDSVFFGPEIVAVPEAVRDSFAWDLPFDEAVREASGSIESFDLDEVRDEIAGLAGAQAMSGLARTRPRVGSISELAHFNRVEGLALGFGWVFRPSGTWEIDVGASYGFSDQDFKGRLETRYRIGGVLLSVKFERRVRDVSEELVISPILNSVLAQEGGQDYGDYFMANRGLGLVEWRLTGRRYLRFTGGVEHTQSLPVVASPANGTFAANPALGSGTFAVGRLSLGQRPSTLGSRLQMSGSATIEGGAARSGKYLRAWATGRVQIPVGVTDIVTQGWGGWGSADLPPHRAFVFGGRGTLVGEPFRAWGGHYAVTGTVEWRIPVPFPAVPLGPFASTGGQLVVAPFAGLGWAGGAIPSMPWQPSSGVRPVVGIGIEWFHRLFRADLGFRLRDPAVSLVVDVRRDLWGIL